MIMTSTSERQVDATAVAAMPAPAVPPAGLDISHIPPTPDDLFVQWKVSRRTAWRAAVAAVLLSIWDAVTGPPATEQERRRREVADAREYSKYMLRW